MTRLNSAALADLGLTKLAAEVETARQLSARDLGMLKAAHDLGLTKTAVGPLAAIPAALGAAGMAALRFVPMLIARAGPWLARAGMAGVRGAGQLGARAGGLFGRGAAAAAPGAATGATNAATNAATTAATNPSWLMSKLKANGAMAAMNVGFGALGGDTGGGLVDGAATLAMGPLAGMGVSLGRQFLSRPSEPPNSGTNPGAYSGTY